MHKLHTIIGYSVIGVTGIVLTVSLAALSNPQTTSSRAAGPASSVNTGTAPFSKGAGGATSPSTSTGTAGVGGGTSGTARGQQMPLPASNQAAGNPADQCVEGPKQLQLGDCGAGVGQPVYAGGGSSGQDETNVGSGGPVTKDPVTVTLAITGVICQDDVVIPWTPFEGCKTMTKEDWGIQMGATLREQMKTLCAGHKSPACNQGGQPQAAGQTGTNQNLAQNCSLFARGDADCNGTVDLYDFKIWLTAYRAGTYDKNADFNGDNVVDLADFVIWKDNYTQ